jgi:Fe-S oxidoreductase
MDIEGKISHILQDTGAYQCMDCGKCTALCPLALFSDSYSPRLLIHKGLLDNVDSFLKNDFIWWCLTCGLCSEFCEAGVRYTEFIKEVRHVARSIGHEGTYAHDGVFQSVMRMMAQSPIKQNRLDWLTDDLKVKTSATSADDVVYFVGCLPYFDVILSNLAVKTVRIARGAVTILNHLGIEPIVMPDERCCGRDLLWTGDTRNFKRLVHHNYEAIRKTGAKRVVFSCPEGYHTFKVEYAKEIKDFDLEIIYIAEIIAQRLGDMTFKKSRKQVTYQDPCSAGRFSGIYEEPRQILEAMGMTVAEMPRNRNHAICCGTSGWVNCGTSSKHVQLSRLTEAKATGADMLVTNCPKCLIHFTCAMRDENTPQEARIEIRDLVTLTADRLKRDGTG